MRASSYALVLILSALGCARASGADPHEPNEATDVDLFELDEAADTDFLETAQGLTLDQETFVGPVDQDQAPTDTESHHQVQAHGGHAPMPQSGPKPGEVRPQADQLTQAQLKADNLLSRLREIHPEEAQAARLGQQPVDTGLSTICVDP